MPALFLSFDLLKKQSQGKLNDALSNAPEPWRPFRRFAYQIIDGDLMAARLKTVANRMARPLARTPGLP